MVVALNQVVLTPQVNGYITGVFFKEGERVKKGQKLYSIDAQTYNANYQQAQANLAVQEANLVRAEKDAERYRELAKKDAIARQQVDNAEAALTAAERQVDAAKAAIQSAQTSVRYTTIVAPFDGTIGISQVRLGASVSAGQTVLNTISSDNPIAVDFVIDQKELYRFSKLQQAKKNDSTFALAFGTEVYPHYGQISVIDRAVDALTSTIKIRATFPNNENLLRAGMSGTMRVLNDASNTYILIPYKAVTEQLGEFFVYAVNGKTVTQTRVKLGKAVGGSVIVKDGLKAGDKIAVEGVQNLKEGATIKVTGGQ
jgi:membrane fusion protein (multidrug efflux system)